MLLSTVAERFFWMARYLERAENTARLLSAYTDQILDLPVEAGPGWRQLVLIIGSLPLFEKHYEEADESQVMRFMISDREHPNAILSCLAAARENARTTRERLPVEAWESLNELYLYAKQNTQQGIGRRNRHRYLREIIFGSQKIAGILAGTMSHDTAYDFLRVGRNLERGDMTTRIVDSAVSILMPRKSTPGPYDDLLWVNVLKSLSAYQMYRLHVHARVFGDGAICYLLQDPKFPRALRHCMDEVSECLQKLPRHMVSLEMLVRLHRSIDTTDIRKLDLAALHQWIDELQQGLAAVSVAIGDTWFHIETVHTVAA